MYICVYVKRGSTRVPSREIEIVRGREGEREEKKVRGKGGWKEGFREVGREGGRDDENHEHTYSMAKMHKMP